MEFIADKNLFRFTIIGPETDIHDRLHYHSLFAMLQEAACIDADHSGFGAEKMDELEACWLLLRMKVTIDKIPHWKDNIYIKTWSCGFQKVLFNRDFAIFDSNMEKIGSATSVWVIAHTGDHRPVRPQMIPGMEVFNNPEAMKNKVDKILPREVDVAVDKPSLSKYADYSDIDRNMHVNNTRYIAWSLDAFYKEVPHDVKIKELSINYSSEVKPGEEVYIYRTSIQDGVQVDGFEASSGRHVFSTILSY